MTEDKLPYDLRTEAILLRDIDVVRSVLLSRAADEIEKLRAEAKVKAAQLKEAAGLARKP